MPTSGGLHINEGDIIKLVLEYLQNRTLHISMLSIERETGVINGLFSDDLLFLRQLILDGQWDDVIDFIQPLISIDGFDSQSFQYIILKHKYLELLCIKSEPNVMQDYEATVDEVVKCLNSLEGICPSKEEYSNLCFLLSLPKLSDHSDYQNWNPSNARVECFKQVQPLIQSYLPIEKKDEQKNQMSCNDRLLQLVLKGVLYESCVDYCQQQATGTDTGFSSTSILNDTGFSDADLSLLAWLQSIPNEIFSCPFEQRSIKVDIKPLIKPSLEASWSEQILVTPIKPKMFPHSAIPSQRPRSADLMTRSLNPQFDGLSRGLIQGVGRLDWSIPSGSNPLSQSIAHLPQTPMMMSMDKLFSEGEVIDTKASISEELKSSPRIAMNANKPASPAISRKSPARSQSPTRSGSIDSMAPLTSDPGTLRASPAASVKDSSNELYKEYQRQRQRVQEQLEIQDKQREMYQKELMELERKTEETLGDNRLHEELLLSQSDAPCPVIDSTMVAKQESVQHLNRGSPFNRDVNSTSPMALGRGSPAVSPMALGRGSPAVSSTTNDNNINDDNNNDGSVQDSTSSNPIHGQTQNKDNLTTLSSVPKTPILNLPMSDHEDELDDDKDRHVTKENSLSEHNEDRPENVVPTKTGNLFLDFTSPPASARLPKLKSPAERAMAAAAASAVGATGSVSAPSSPLPVRRRNSLPQRSATPSSTSSMKQIHKAFGVASVFSQTTPNTPTTPRPARRSFNSVSSAADEDLPRNIVAFVLPEDDDEGCAFTICKSGSNRGNTISMESLEQEEIQPTTHRVRRNVTSPSTPSSPRKNRSHSFGGASQERPRATTSRTAASNRRPKTPDPSLMSREVSARGSTATTTTKSRLSALSSPRGILNRGGSSSNSSNATTLAQNPKPGLSKTTSAASPTVASSLKRTNSSGASTLPRRKSASSAPSTVVPSSPSTGSIKGAGTGAGRRYGTNNNNNNSNDDGRSRTLPLPAKTKAGRGSVTASSDLRSPSSTLRRTNSSKDPSSSRSTPTKSTTISSAAAVPSSMMTSPPASTTSSTSSLREAGGRANTGKPRFIPVTTIDDGQAIRAIAFHPRGQYYAIGSNSKMLRICAFPNMANLREEHVAYETSVVYKHTKHHKGSLYCVAWNPLGDLIATGSNDKTIRLVRFNEDSMSAEGDGMELSFHDGTVRDLVFMQDVTNRSSLLISGGAGDCKNYVTDCQTGAPIRAMKGHTGHIYSLHTWGGCMFVSGSQDKTARFWDLRASSAITVVPSPSGSAFASVCVDPSGRLLVSGHEDGTVSLYDIRGAKVVQTFQPHSGECRSARFSTNAYYLMTVAYDGRVVLTDLHGDLLRPLPSVVVGEHKDKVIQCRWHPTQFAFVTCSADKTAICWGLPMADMRS